MKHIYKGLVFCAALAFANTPAAAQETLADLVEAIQTDTLPKVQVAFRSVDRNDLLGGVSVIDMKEMSEKAYSNNSLGFVDNAVGGFNGNIWGNTEYLVIIDGMVRDANNVLPHEIDQITLLKGASAVVLYGPRAAKGVISITTKRGEIGDLRINIHANSGFYTPKSYPKYLGSAEYMTLYNEARVNDGQAINYSPETIYNHASGSNPYRYPDFDMYSSDYLKKAYNRSEAIAEISGGSGKVRYYTTTGYYRESSLLKVGKTEDNYISRFFVRGNVDMELHKLIKAQADANVTFYDSYAASVDWWGQAATLRPHLVTPFIPLSYIEANDKNSLNTVLNSSYIQDGKFFFGGTQQNPTNPVADAYAAGDSKFVSRQFQFNTRFDVNLSPLLKGLYFRAKYGIDYASTYNQGYKSSYATFAPVWSNYNGKDVITSIMQYGKDEKSGSENIDNSAYRYTYNVSGQFDYQRTINADHNIFGMVLANAWQTQQSGRYHRTTNANLGFQASYNYQHKYYADFSAAMPYSTKLPEGNRFAFSPTLTLGWNLAKESFMENSIFDDLMLTASAGIINQDLDITSSENVDGYYLYKAVIQSGGWYSWGDNGGLAATEFQRGDNPDMTYVKRKEFAVGLRGSLLNRLLNFDFNFFSSKMDGGLARTSSLYPNYFTQTGYPTSSIIPFINYNEDKRTGFDFSVYANKKVGEVNLTLGVSGMYYKSIAKKRDENIEFDYLSAIDRPLNGHWGLQSEGFFQSQAEIESAPTQTFGDVKPGDIRYKDQNNDGKIDNNDRVMLGRWDSPFMSGINLTVAWKDFTLYAMGNLYIGGYGMKDNSYYWVKGDGKYSEEVRNRWTPETAATATYPRLTTTDGANNYRTSDFWMYKNDRFNLTQVQLTYKMPQRVLRGTFIKGLSFFANANNLLTIAKERKALELRVGGAPQTRFYQLGFKGTF
ncbi:SusC/RagA family TonB-linked outer membrane protein [Bacteroides cellulosilyticus]|jgi:TonB-linked SusC/RagA family outer membrane protein|uniref:SusC/RagA family TonB-linked outer membrane protein n=1 Tax=Bacteroides cellulosilyticus TaxID=246787 RepID=UPI001C37DAF2|nr:SusC/RagA family TonB-linked outer membrane protein [Bacteroides cellulosilyticus]MBV3639717.1 SusC/RagA family TonB-linked outer membrane protein [Bacteroides cellulosilyticus]MBV3664851.1 SusC/RagA family TonB-linked outer membrane protein [Bacteroides cellulosilyticus]MBV3687414.1 SusC/RagA family TonB-linked outer membrane protein [Bacteroides cellulosilyticus]MBV3696562.1 SusC/RagA family TonB-linked outer membrane protein [Bacteroides cellulosilyticus]MBV3710128.1 SusC/RagA family Ton